ncbi:hypothetical protein EYZ11_011198 [Aspergillus tanneri]|uniref:Uncharacterized protein n=1 Tax=Aspergillus tanneri TaxID=1220188 RepID=A0A4S3J3E2_9EURO|nr:hypothetical protein EYZ11_011198 [Aspergillus tanneri]
MSTFGDKMLLGKLGCGQPTMDDLTAELVLNPLLEDVHENPEKYYKMNRMAH